jgi:hypothetical protein
MFRWHRGKQPPMTKMADDGQAGSLLLNQAINAYFTTQQTGCLFFVCGYNGARA